MYKDYTCVYSEYIEREQQKWLSEMKNEHTSMQEVKKIKNGIIIHCNTPNEANELLQFLKTQGYTWHGWCLMPEENSWDYYKSNTGYLLWNHKILCSMRDYLRWKMDNACSAECMEFSEFKSKYMEKENPIVKTKPDGTYKEALGLCTQMLTTLQRALYTDAYYFAK